MISYEVILSQSAYKFNQNTAKTFRVETNFLGSKIRHKTPQIRTNCRVLGKRFDFKTPKIINTDKSQYFPAEYVGFIFITP